MAKGAPAVLEELEAQEITHLLKIRNKMPFSNFSGITGQCQHSLNHMQTCSLNTFTLFFYSIFFSSLPKAYVLQSIQDISLDRIPQVFTKSTLGVLKHVM